MTTNPFTHQTLNANPEGHNQYTINPVHPTSRYHSYLNLEESAKPAKLELGSSGIKVLGKGYAAQGDSSSNLIRVGAGEFSREVAAHEIGHSKIGYIKPIMAGSLDSGRIKNEEKAWKWALDNAKRLGLSRRKLKRLARVSVGSYKKEFKRQILSAPSKVEPNS